MNKKNPYPDPIVDAILKHSSQCLVVIDAEYQIQHSNCSCFGRAVETLQGASYLEIIAHPDRLTVEQALTQVLHTGAPVAFDCCIIGANDETRRFHTQALPLPAEQGAGRVLLLVDQSPKLHPEELMPTLAARLPLPAIIDQVTDLIHVKDLEGRYILVNQAAGRFLNTDPREILNRNDMELIPPEQAQKLIEHDRQVLATGNIVTFEEQVMDADGNRRIFLSTKGPLRDSSGHIFALFSFSKDITEVTAEARHQTLATSFRLLEHALTSAELGVWDVDLISGECCYDARYSAMLGYKPTELDSTLSSAQARVHPKQRDAAVKAWHEHLSGDTPRYESEHRLRHKDGHWLWVLVRGKASYDAAGHAVQCTGTMMDISQHQRLIKENAYLLQRIERLIREMAEQVAAQEPPAGSPCPKPLPLTPRQRQVLGLIAKGLTAQQIAERLCISTHTVMTHRRDLMRKLGLNNKTELIRYALEHRIEIPD